MLLADFNYQTNRSSNIMARLTLNEMSATALSPASPSGARQSSTYFLGRLPTEFADDADTAPMFSAVLRVREILAELADQIAEIETDGDLSEAGKETRIRNLGTTYLQRVRAVQDDLTSPLNALIRVRKRIEASMGDPLPPAVASELRATIKELPATERTPWLRRYVAAGNRDVAAAVLYAPVPEMLGIAVDAHENLNRAIYNRFADPEDVAQRDRLTDALTAAYRAIRAAQALIADLTGAPVPAWTGPEEFLPARNSITEEKLIPANPAGTGMNGAQAPQDPDAAGQAAAALG